MAFNAGELVAYLRMDGVDRFKSDARGAGDALKSAGREADKAATATSKAGNAARAAFSTASGVILGAAGATTAYTASVVATGVAYNTLQQTSRAALTTLLGGTEAANAQMNKLDEFARNSPFAKSTFIKAQQQLIGFGVEAERVVPILSAVQDATAAVGGSNQQIEEIVTIFAKIQSSGKITAEELNELGDRGLDAATLLGEAFGKSAKDIREEISEGTIDAGQALEALTEQMSSKFGGAAAGVKDTWVGTVDRIKAANREIGATLVEPFISQQGGGYAITWGNQVADVLRAVLGHVQPIVTIMQDRLLPTFASITGGLETAQQVVKSWDSSSLEGFLNSADRYAPALGGVAGGLAAMASGLLANIPVLGSFVGAVNPIVGVLGGIALASPEVRDALGDLLGAFEPLVPVAGDVARVFASGLNIALPLVADLIEGVADVAGPLVEILGEIPTPVLLAAAAFLTLKANASGIEDFARPIIEFVQRQAEIVAMQQALGAMGGATSGMGAASILASRGVQGLGEALKGAFLTNPIGIALTGIAAGVGALVWAFSAQAEHAAAAEEAIVSYRETLNSTTGALTDATNAAIENTLAEQDVIDAGDKLGLSKETLIAAVRGEKDALDAVREAYHANAGGAGDYLTTEGKLREEAGLVNSVILEQNGLLEQSQEETRADAEEKQALLAAMTDTGRAIEGMNAAMEVYNDTTSDAATKTNALKAALDELAGGTKSAHELERELNDQVRSLGDAFAQTDENGQRLAASLVDTAGKIDTTTAAGSNLSKQVESMNDAMLDAVVAADENARARGEERASLEEIQGIYDQYTGKLRTVAEEAGLSEEQVGGLITTMFDVPTDITFLVSNGGTIDENKLRLYELARDILATPDKDFNISNDDIPGLLGMLQTLGYQTEHLPDGTVRVYGNGIDTVLGGLGSIDAMTYDRSMTVTTRHLSIFETINRGVTEHQGAPMADWDGRANGGIEEYANGGVREGMYRGRPGGLIKFAEPETRWEAFISGKLGQERRNRAIAAEAVRRLGGAVTFDPTTIAGAPRAFANGGILDTQRHLDATVREEYRDWQNWTKARQLADANPDVDWIQEREKRYLDGYRDAESRRKSLERELESSKDSLVGAQEDFYADLRRGNIRQQGMNGGGMQLVDRLNQAGKDTGGRTGQEMREQARRSEEAFLRLERQAEDAADALAKAETDRQERDRKAQEQARALLDQTEQQNNDRTRKAQEQADKILDESAERQRQRTAETQAEIDAVQDASAERQKARTQAAEERAVAHVDRITRRWGDRLDELTGKWNDQIAASEAMSSNVAAAIRGFYDLGAMAQEQKTTRTVTERTSRNVGGINLTSSQTREVEETRPVTSKTLRNQFAAAASGIKAFAGKLKRLAAKGIDTRLLAEIAGMGVDAGGTLADALLSASAADIASINSNYRTINTASAQAGRYVAEENYADVIASLEKQLAAMGERAEKEIAAAERRAEEIRRQAAWLNSEDQRKADQRARELERATVRRNRTDQAQANKRAWQERETARQENWKAMQKAEKEAKKITDRATKESNRQIAAAEKNRDKINAKLKTETDRIISALNKGLSNPWKAEGRATGGAIRGPGGPTSDDIPAWLSNGEHVWTAAEVRAAGGHRRVEMLRRAVLDGRIPAFAGGGPVITAAGGSRGFVERVETRVESERSIDGKVYLVVDGQEFPAYIKTQAGAVVSENDLRRRRVISQGRQAR